MEQPDAPELVKRSGLITRLEDVTFFLGREHLIVAERSATQRWRVVSFLARSSQPATRFSTSRPIA
jgi:hypothetical protein